MTTILTIQAIAFAILTIEKTILETLTFETLTFEILITILTIENLNSWQSLLPGHWTLGSFRNSCDVFTKELPQNTAVIQSEHTEQYSKVSMTAPSRGSLCMISAVDNNIIMSRVCLGQHLGHIDNNGQQSVVLHQVAFMHLWCRFLLQDFKGKSRWAHLESRD